MNLDVKLKQGQYANLPEDLALDTLYFAKDQAVMGAAGKLYYGQPTIEYKMIRLFFGVLVVILIQS